MARGWIAHVVLNGDARQMCGGLREVRFAPGVNLLAGPNGSGKSTILRVLRDRSWASDQGCEVWKEGDKIEWVAFDSEQDDPRGRPGVGPLQFMSHVGSHGEVQRRVFEFIERRVRPGMLVLLDEPEAAMDIHGVQKFFALVQKRADLQWIIASHHPLLWKLPGARIIELAPGHVARTVAAWQQALGG